MGFKVSVFHELYKVLISPKVVLLGFPVSKYLLLGLKVMGFKVQVAGPNLSQLGDASHPCLSERLTLGLLHSIFFPQKCRPESSKKENQPKHQELFGLYSKNGG